MDRRDTSSERCWKCGFARVDTQPDEEEDEVAHTARNCDDHRGVPDNARAADRESQHSAAMLRDISQALTVLASDVRDFWAPSAFRVKRVRAPINPLAFYKEFVSKNTPAIICGALDDWPAMHRWNDESYMIAKAKNPEVSVNVTPSGLGDHVLELDGGREIFVKPEERTMRLAEFFDCLKDPDYDGVPYLSHQNDSLRAQFHELEDDIKELEFAKHLFGPSPPDAVNLWIGDQRSVSSVHKDHYENLYCVVTGEKHFTLLPPTDFAFLHESEYAAATYQSKQSTAKHKETQDDDSREEERYELNAHWEICFDRAEESEEEGCCGGGGGEGYRQHARTKWIPVDPGQPDMARYPDFISATPLHVVVRAGEILYLPSLWYHKVCQYEKTIAVNFWFDMDFDHKWAYYNFIRNVVMAQASTSQQAAAEDGVASSPSSR